MLQIFRKKDGAVSVFLTIILVPMIVVSCLFVDACRAKLAEPVVSSAGDLTLNTALTQYDATLNDYYGLMASSQNVDEFLNNANEYFQAFHGQNSYVMYWDIFIHKILRSFTVI